VPSSAEQKEMEAAGLTGRGGWEDDSGERYASRDAVDGGAAMGGARASAEWKKAAEGPPWG
jgi:hypothetical protein